MASRASRTFRLAGPAGAAMLLAAMPGGPAGAQVPLVDYEPAARTEIQQGAAWRLAFRPALQVLQQTVGQLRNTPGVTPVLQTRADQLVEQARAQPEPEARRTLWRAVSLLTGKAWTPEQALLGALALRTPTSVWTGQDDVLTLDRLYPAASREPATYALDVFASEPTTSATPKRGAFIGRAAAGAIARGAATRIRTRTSDLPDGAYLLIAQIRVGSQTTELAQPVYIIRDLDRRYAALKAGLARVPGHEEAKTLAEYPFALAQAIRAGRREIISYDFPGAIARSSRLLAHLEAGRDDIRQGKGLQDRAYRFPETGEIVPYQLYVPSAWTPDRTWPLVVALHGANLDETNMLGRDGGRMQTLAEQHGVIVAAPLGYRLNSAYGSERGFSRAIVGDEAERRRRSEADVLHVMDLVAREYNVDPHRRYLTGNSMGGGGTWWIGAKYPERWAALAPVAYGGVLPEDVPRLARTPLMVVVGDHDDLMLERVRASVATLRAGGVQPRYVEVPGGTHASGFEIALPKIFQFFENHAK